MAIFRARSSVDRARFPGGSGSRPGSGRRALLLVSDQLMTAESGAATASWANVRVTSLAYQSLEYQSDPDIVLQCKSAEC